MQLKFCVNINKTLEVIRTLVMTVFFFVSPCILMKRHFRSVLLEFYEAVVQKLLYHTYATSQFYTFCS